VEVLMLIANPTEEEAIREYGEPIAGAQHFQTQYDRYRTLAPWIRVVAANQRDLSHLFDGQQRIVWAQKRGGSQ
jgi:urease accessory protein UreH